MFFVCRHCAIYFTKSVFLHLHLGQRTFTNVHYTKHSHKVKKDIAHFKEFLQSIRFSGIS